MTQHLALIRKESGTAYWVEMPDVPGCVSRGDTIDEAKKNFADALALHLSGTDRRAAIRTPPRRLEELSEEERDGCVATYFINL
jgi:Uncharacterized conserved protein